jgi:hypothetical protein
MEARKNRTRLCRLLLMVVLTGCIDRDRVNRHCEWTGDTAFHIDPRNGAHQQHLVHDAQLAEDLAVRYADAEHLRRFGYDGHGGLIDKGGVVGDCMARLVSTIEEHHSVTPEQVYAARAHRDWRFDLAVAALFIPLYWFSSTVVSGRLARRFSSDRGAVRIVATGLTSLVVSFLGLQAGQLWLAAWETIRVRNGHIGAFRRASWVHPWGDHAGVVFVGAAVLFWLIALSSDRIPKAFPAGAAMLACTVLAVALAATFVQYATGYAIAVVAVVAINSALWFAGRLGVESEDRASSARLLGSRRPS